VVETVASHLVPVEPDAREATFHGVLFGERDAAGELVAPEPDCFRDLGLDRVVEGVTSGREEYNLRPFFHVPLGDPTEVRHRHDVFRDLEDGGLLRAVNAFAMQMRSVRQCLRSAQTATYRYSSERWFLDAVGAYCAGVEQLRRDLGEHDVGAAGLQSFRTYLANLVESNRFTTLAAETRQLQATLTTIRYCLLIKEGTVTVRKFEAEADYGPAVEDAFAVFRQNLGANEPAKLPPPPAMNHIHAMILERVALLNREAFATLEGYPKQHHRFLDEGVVRFDREIQFYVACFEFTEPLRRAGLKLCYPDLLSDHQGMRGRNIFDLALAAKLVREDKAVVCNDFDLRPGERLVVVTGPNQGGKTTFARAFGQLCYLATLGVPVPGTEARLSLADRVLTHFEREESLASLHGKLQDDLVRMHRILTAATRDSVLVINEMFSSTTAKDALDLSSRILAKIMELGSLCVCVTFLDELSRLTETTVSLVATVAPEDADRRTYKLQRKPADGMAFALAIVEKYRLSSEKLKERMKR
jgi:DNA mismatch repair protein MutS